MCLLISVACWSGVLVNQYFSVYWQKQNNVLSSLNTVLTNKLYQTKTPIYIANYLSGQLFVLLSDCLLIWLNLYLDMSKFHMFAGWFNIQIWLDLFRITSQMWANYENTQLSTERLFHLRTSPFKVGTLLW